MWDTQPVKFGLFHIIVIIIALIAVAFGIYFGHCLRGEAYEKKRDLILTIFGFSLLALEAFKVIFTICVGAADLTLISFQICSTPMYFLPFVFFLKRKWLKEVVYSYPIFVGFASAMAYLVNPAAMIKTPYIIMSIHSALFHIALIFVGAFGMVGYELTNKRGIIAFSKAYVIFVILSLIAMTTDFIVRHYIPDTKMNLFYLYPDGNTFPIIDAYVRPYVPYPVYFLVFLAMYYATVMIFSSIVFLSDFLIKKFQNKKVEEQPLLEEFAD